MARSWNTCTVFWPVGTVDHCSCSQ
jgi:hypothetical protein